MLGPGYTLNRNASTAILPLLKEDPHFPFDNYDAGSLLAVSSSSYAVGKLVLGFLVDMVGGKWTFMFGLLVSLWCLPPRVVIT